MLTEEQVDFYRENGYLVVSRMCCVQTSWRRHTPLSMTSSSSRGTSPSRAGTST